MMTDKWKLVNWDDMEVYTRVFESKRSIVLKRIRNWVFYLFVLYVLAMLAQFLAVWSSTRATIYQASRQSIVQTALANR